MRWNLVFVETQLTMFFKKSVIIIIYIYFIARKMSMLLFQTKLLDNYDLILISCKNVMFFSKIQITYCTNSMCFNTTILQPLSNNLKKYT